MSTTEAPHDVDPGDVPQHRHRELRLAPPVPDGARVPADLRPTFDLAAFVRAREHQDVASQLACYAPDADVRIVDPDSPPAAARTLRGSEEISSWLDRSGAYGVEVTHLVDGGDRVAFSEGWQQPDGIAVVATTIAELRSGLIARQHTVLAWARRPADPVDPGDGWTRLSRDLWTRAD